MLHIMRLHLPGWTIVVKPPLLTSLRILLLISACVYVVDAEAESKITAWGRPVVTNVPPVVTNVVDLAAGDGFAVALLANGTVAAWGTNIVAVTNVPAGLSNLVAISAAGRHVLVLQADGTVKGWGAESSHLPPRAATNCITIAAGPGFDLALRSDGALISWPKGPYFPAGGLSNIVGMAAGLQHGLAVTTGRKVVAWGDNSAGQIDVPRDLSNVVSVAAGERFSAALTAEGALVIWGTNSYAPTPDLSQAVVFRSIAASRYHLLALRADGSIFAWGANFSGQTNVPPTVERSVLVAAGDNVSLAIGGDVPPHVSSPLLSRTALLNAPCSFEPRATGSLPLSFQWTFNGQPLPSATEQRLILPNAGLADAGMYSLTVSNHAGTDSTPPAGLDVSQMVVWGNGALALTNIPPGLTNLVTISGGGGHVLGLNRDGTVISWGNKAPEVPPGLSNIVAVAAGYGFAAALSAEGRVITWGRCIAGPLPVPAGLTDVKAIAAGYFQVMALKADGTVVVWGAESAGDFSSPADLDNVASVATSFGACAALKAHGRIVSWPTFPVLGPNDPNAITDAVILAGTTSFSVHHMLALRANGSVAVWGYTPYRYLPPPIREVEALAGGTSHDIALLRDGSVIAWGSGLDGVTNVPPWLPAVTEIASTGGAIAVMVGLGPPYITSALLDRRIAAGETVQFKVRATGEHPLRYQWNFNGEAIAGATDSLLVLPVTTSASSGRYSVVVRNDAGTAEGALTLSVVPATVDHQPRSVTNLLGSTVVFETEAQGQNLHYQWQRNGVDLPGQTNSILRVENVGHFHAGMYRAVITNELGSVQTREAALNLQQVVCWGSPSGLSVSAFMTGRTNLLGIAAGDHGSLAIDQSLTLLPINETNIIAASASLYFTLMLRENGTVAVHGENPAGPTQPPADLANVVAVAAGFYHALALRSDGTVVAWGADSAGATNVPSGLRDVVAIAAGHQLSLALRADGTVVQWGDSREILSMPEGLTNIVRISASISANIALRADGTVVTWGLFDYPGRIAQPPPATLSNVIAVAAGANHYLALTADGRVTGWGENNFGQADVPPGLCNVQAIALGFNHSLALTDSHPPVLQGALRLVASPDIAEFAASLQSTLNSVFALEYAENLDEPEWQHLPLVAGTGREIVLKDPSPAPTTRFYRVRRW